MEIQTAYDELKSNSEKEISDLRLQIASLSPFTSKGKYVFLSNKKWKANRSSIDVRQKTELCNRMTNRQRYNIL